MLAEKLRRLTDLLDGWPAFLAIIPDDRWPTMRRRLARAQAGTYRVPQPDGMCAVLASEPIGEPVTDLAATLRELLEAQPLDDRRARAGGPWKLAGADDDDQDQDQAEPEWIPDGILTAQPARLVAVAQELGIYRGPLAMRGRGEAHLMEFPDDREVWRRWKRWAGLVQDLPGPRRRRPGAARLAS